MYFFYCAGYYNSIVDLIHVHFLQMIMIHISLQVAFYDDYRHCDVLINLVDRHFHHRNHHRVWAAYCVLSLVVYVTVVYLNVAYSTENEVYLK